MVIDTDASLLGWGAHPDQWTVVEQGVHDAYQLLGATSRSICSKSPQESKQRYLHPTQNGQYNSCIIYQQNGGTHSHTPAKMACSLWHWCLGRGIVLSVEHLPGLQNAEWQLHKMVFKNILTLLGQCQVDLFATR